MFKAVAAFSKPLAAASFFLVLSGAVRAPTVELCAQAAWVYVLTFVQAKQFLYQYDARQDAAAWATFTAEHRWALFGFGLPSWAATQYVHPLAGLLLLEAALGAPEGPETCGVAAVAGAAPPCAFEAGVADRLPESRLAAPLSAHLAGEL